MAPWRHLLVNQLATDAPLLTTKGSLNKMKGRVSERLTSSETFGLFPPCGTKRTKEKQQ
jgi:hypothetical protein